MTFDTYLIKHKTCCNTNKAIRSPGAVFFAASLAPTCPICASHTCLDALTC